MLRHVFVFDPTDDGKHHIPNGKQTRHPSHIFYEPCSGIWQTVWLERVKPTHIKDLHIAADMHGRGKHRLWCFKWSTVLIKPT